MLRKQLYADKSRQNDSKSVSFCRLFSSVGRLLHIADLVLYHFEFVAI